MVKLGMGCAALVVARLFTSASATAAEDLFGKQGQLVIDNRLQLLATTTRVTQGEGSSELLQLNPSAAYFVLPSLSVGLGVSFGYRQWDPGFGVGTNKQKTLGVAPRVGYAIALGDRFDLYPEVEVSWSRAWSPDASYDEVWSAGASVPVLFRPAPHFFVGLGPSVVHRRYRWEEYGFSDVGLVEVGLRSTLGGYFEL